MKLNRQTIYGVRCIMHLAHSRSPLSASVLAEKTGLSKNFAARVLQPYMNAKLVESVTGTYGGYFLRDRPENITLLQAVCIAENIDDFHDCFITDAHLAGDVQSMDALRAVFADCSDYFDKRLGGVTIADLIAKEPHSSG